MHDALREPQTESARSGEASWRPRALTPSRRSDDISKFRLTLRDAILLLVGCIGMYGAQVARDYGLRSDMRDLQTSFDASVRSQQQQIDQWRQETKLNGVNIANVQTELAKLQGILMGAGIKGVTK